MHFAKDIKFWKHTTGKKDSKDMEPESQGLEDKKINSKKNLILDSF